MNIRAYGSSLQISEEPYFIHFGSSALKIVNQSNKVEALTLLNVSGVICK